MLYKILISTTILLIASLNYGSDKLTAPLAPYENKGVGIKQQKPVLKEAAATTTHWSKKVNYKKAGFYIGNKSLNVKEALATLKVDSDSVLYIVISGKIVATFQMWGSTKGGYGHPFALVKDSKPQLKVDQQQGMFSWRKEFYLNKDKTEAAYFNYTATLQQNGLIKLEWKVEATDEQWKKYRTDYALFINFRDFFEKKIIMNGKLCSFVPGKELKAKKDIRYGKGNAINLSITLTT